MAPKRKQTQPFDYRAALRKSQLLIKQILHMTVIFSNLAGGTGPMPALQAKLTNITGFGQELDDLFPTDSLQADLVSTTLEDAGFVREHTETKGTKKKTTKTCPAVWKAPDSWTQHYAALSSLSDLLTEVTFSDDFEENGKAPQKGKAQAEAADPDLGSPFCTPNAPVKAAGVRFSPDTQVHEYTTTAVNTPDVVGESSGQGAARMNATAAPRNNSDASGQSAQPTLTPLGNTLGKPIDLSQDGALNEMVAKALAGGDGLGAYPKATGTLASMLDLPSVKKRSRQSLEIGQGKVEVKQNMLLPFEKYMENGLSTLMKTPDSEKFIFMRYLVMIIILHRDFEWWAVLEFDQDCRDRFRDGELVSLDPAALTHTFYLNFGMRRKSTDSAYKSQKVSSAPRTPANARPQATKICQYFNSGTCKKGSSCNFKHVCDKCGSREHGSSRCTA